MQTKYKKWGKTMAIYRFDVGLIMYNEVIVKADDIEDAKMKLSTISADLKEGKGFTGRMNSDEDVSWSMVNKSIDWYGIKPNSVVQLGEEIPIE